MDHDTAPTRAEQVRLYLDTLRARMNPAEFRVLGRILPGAVASLATPDTDHFIDVPDEDRPHLTSEVEDELLAVLSIVATGTMEHHIVDLGDGATTALDTGAAADPEAVRRMRDWAARQRDQRDGRIPVEQD
ncbi:MULTISPECIES: hypothetical protein [Kitasatospora]|uniref:Uncharacterized protein n=1 Tax=Kitasatospora setae (strain ATCC 33774 / DSM 43861 / JCM 3304 / KCC A-0304 / NBRC 14216 / KM-6054) TaxID=452652 RepID=E4N0Z5_KITSK|nr:MULTISPECIES: hypothetical protein [Kitasatospora]BAJ31829.1 hypothetical protein KSE_60630 [Kitasatospora setae KM-6054]